MNKLLLRQIGKHWGSPENVPAEIKNFLSSVSDTYDYHDRNRIMLERSIELSSDEMIGLYDRIRAESKELAKAHEELKTLFRNIETVFFTVDVTQGKVVQMSPSCEKIYGYTAEDFLNDNNSLWYDAVLEEDKHIIQANYALMYAGKSFSHAHRIKAKDGTIRWIESKLTPTLGADGSVIRIDGITSDITAQKEAEEERLNIETRYRKLIEKSHDGISLLAADGRLLYVSPSVEHILGYTTAELIDTDPGDLTHPDDKDALVALLMDLFRRFGESARAVYRMKNKSGEWRWISSTITNLLAEKSVNALVFNYQDISDFKRSEDQLEYDRRNRDALINSTTDLMWSFDSDLRLITANRSFLTAMKYVSGIDLHAGDDLMVGVFDETTLNKWEGLYKRVLSGEAFVYENHETAAGEQWAELTFNPILEDGKVVGGSCCWHDITEKKIYHQQLEASARMMADAQRIARFGSWEAEFDEDGNLPDHKITWTEEMYRIFGLDSATYVPGVEQYMLLIHPADQELVADWITAVKQGEGPGSIDYRIHTPEGQRRWVKTTADLIRDKKTGHRTKLVGTVQNITERKTLERERHQITKDLVQRNKTLEQFAHIVSHNLRAPVANILGLSNLIKLSEGNADTQRQCIDGLTLSAKRLDEIILDLNKILQVKQGMSEEKDMIHLDTLVSNIKDSIQMIIEQENVTIITDFNEITQLYTIKNYLHSIFFNLISNSIKYRRHSVRPVIEISSRTENGKTLLAFKDNCMGIDLEKHGHNLFGLYKRFHHNVEGKGMGMYMVKTQVESLGGKIGIKSKVDQGTEITVEI